MTDVLALQHDDEYRLECKNHADSTEVCAGISALCFALAGSLVNHDNVNVLQLDLQPGYAKIAFQSEETRADEDFRQTLIGLLQIQESHPDEINIVQNIFN